MHTLYFTRHGETVWNVENKICGMTDSPLTERGRQQARKLGEAVKASGVHIDEILYSPLSRAADTAMAIAEATGLPARCEPRLREQCFGKYEGTPRNGGEFRISKTHFADRYDGGEEQQDVQRRLRQAKLLTQRLADGIVRLRGLDGKFDIRVHSRSILSSLNDSFLNYYSAEEERCQGGTPSVAAYAAPAPSMREPLAWRQSFRACQRPHPRGRLPPAGTDSPRAGEKCHRR